MLFGIPAALITFPAVRQFGAADAGRNWDLRCRLREGLIAYLQREFPQHLPRGRAEAWIETRDAKAEG